MGTLKDKVAIVTGGSRGIGAAIAMRLAHDGAKVVVNYSSNRSAADKVAESIRRSGGQATVEQADLQDQVAIKRLVEQVLKSQGRIDILVNNAGVYDTHPIGELNAAQYARVFDVNVRAPLLLAAEVERHLPRGGRIINISSAAATMSAGSGVVYAASKGAIEAMTRVLAAELGERGITANAVAPGITETDMLREGATEELKQEALKRTPLHRVGKPEDIADVVAFLASDDARWVTGQVIGASGGLVMR